jgi:hypothetical protein
LAPRESSEQLHEALMRSRAEAARLEALVEAAERAAREQAAVARAVERLLDAPPPPRCVDSTCFFTCGFVW